MAGRFAMEERSNGGNAPDSGWKSPRVVDCPINGLDELIAESGELPQLPGPHPPAIPRFPRHPVETRSASAATANAVLIISYLP